MAILMARQAGERQVSLCPWLVDLDAQAGQCERQGPSVVKSRDGWPSRLASIGLMAAGYAYNLTRNRA